MISIIIPAYNEEHVIARCVVPLLPAAKNKEIEIIVVCNGCTDNTAQIVASFEEIKLIETPVPSKTNALNLGDQAASGFPRFYLDADVVISLESVKKVAEVLTSGEVLAAAPQAERKRDYASWFIRSYYDVWERLPYVQEGMIGIGVYALSREGRKRFEKFPNIIADDGYIRALFLTHERRNVEDATCLVFVPKKIGGLLKISKRSRIGNYELWNKFPILKKNEDKLYKIAVISVLSDIQLWHKSLVYLCVNVLSRIMAKKHFKKQGTVGWERDDSSRRLV